MIRKCLFVIIGGIFGLLTVTANTISSYQLPTIPDSLITPVARGNYLIEHYWDNFEVESRNSLDKKELVEQIFVDYTTMMRIALRDNTMTSIDILLKRAGGDEDILLMYVDLAERYLYSGEGDFVSDEAYLPFVKAVIDSPKVSKLNKLRYQYQYDVLTQNQLGMRVTNFKYKHSGKSKQISIKKLKSPFVLLFINDPDCDDCSLMTLRMSASQWIWDEIRAGRLVVMSLFPDGETEEWLSQVSKYPKEWIVASMENGDQVFDLRTLPMLYLLDKNKKIVLKNPSLEELEAYLKKQ